MAEVGLVRFARVAHEIASSVLPEYRTKYSKRIFTQPQLLAVLLLMRYEDWTYREAETRLAEHAELREALRLERVPDYTCLYRFTRRLEKQAVDHAVALAARRVPPPPSGGAVIAVDGTGLETCSISAYFVKRTDSSIRRHYLKWVISVDTDRLVITSQIAHKGPTNDNASLPDLIEVASRVGPIGIVLADGEFDSEQNHDFIRNHIDALSVIPPRRSKTTGSARGVRREMQLAFPADLYKRRALVESVFSIIKRKLSQRAPGRSLETQAMQAYLLGLAFNVYRLRLHRYARQSQTNLVA